MSIRHAKSLSSLEHAAMRRAEIHSTAARRSRLTLLLRLIYTLEAKPNFFINQMHPALMLLLSQAVRCHGFTTKSSRGFMIRANAWGGDSEQGSWGNDDRNDDRRGGESSRGGRGRGGGGGGGGRGRGGGRNTGYDQRSNERTYDKPYDPRYDQRSNERVSPGGGSYERRPRSDAFEARRLASDGMDNLYGVTPVLNALIANRRASFVELLVQERVGEGSSSKLTLSKDVSQIVDLAEKLGVPVSTVPKHDLNMLASNRPHQGVMLTASPLETENLAALPPAADSSQPPCWLVLDEVMDPQNLGALLRSACYLGAEGVVVCTKNSAALSAVVSKASAGALEITTIHSTRNMPRFLAQSVENGWRVVGTTLGQGSIPLRELEAKKEPTILVLGNEGHGLRTLVQRACSTLVNIEKMAMMAPSVADEDSSDSNEGEFNEDDMRYSSASGRSAGVDSLNVAVTGGIILHHLLA